MNAIIKGGHHVFKPGTQIIIYRECPEKWAKGYWETDHGILAKSLVEVLDNEQHFKDAQIYLF